MAVLDIILLVCFIPAIVSGISKGFIKQCINIVALLAGVWAAFHFSEPLSVWLGQFFTLEKTVLHIISFAIVALIAVLLLNLVGNLLGKALDSLSLGWLDKVLGIVLAIFKTALILGLLIIVFDGLNAKWNLVNPDTFNDTVVWGAIKDFASKILPFLKEFIAGIPAEVTSANV